MYKTLLIIISNVIIYGSSLTGLTLFSVGTESYLLNNDLDQIYKWNHTQSTVGTSYLIPDRTILVQLRCEHSFGFSHGPIGGRFQKINFDEEVIWDFSYFTDEYHPHHAVERKNHTVKSVYGGWWACILNVHSDYFSIDRFLKKSMKNRK